MSLARKLALLGGMMLAVLAFSTSTAFADPVEVRDNGVHCSDIGASAHEVQGGCHLQALSIGTIDLEIDVHIPGTHTQGPLCENDFEVRLDGAGEGYVQHFLIFPGGPTCGTAVRPCNEGEAHAGDGPWRVHIEETGLQQETATVEVCLVISGTGRCEGPVNVDVIRDGEQYFAEVADGIPCNGSSNLEAEFVGHYVLVNEPEEEIHVVHPVG